MDTLKCSKCGESKTPDNFYKRSDRPRGRQSKCKTCVGNSTMQVREWRTRNPEAAAANRQRSRVKVYDLTIDEYNALLDKQDSACAICRKTEPGGKGRWHIDHNHETGKVRGLLCAMCNVGLGNFYDDIALLSGAIKYLEETDDSLAGEYLQSRGSSSEGGG